MRSDTLSGIFDGSGAPLRRRAVLLGLGAAALCPAASAAAEDALAAVERRSGGRLGAFALDTGSGRSLAHRADERFLMCSTTKLASVAAVLARVDAGAERLDRRVPYTAAEIAVGYDPDTAAHLSEGGMTLDALCRAAIVHSDNGAANLIFASLGGPDAVTRFVRGLGDAASRFDRVEPALNHPDGERDTTTPRAFAGLTRALLLGDALAPPSRARLDGWTVACETGLKRIRAGVPAGWTVGDKTGTAGPVADDVAVLRPPGRPPIVVAAYCDAPGLADAAREAVLAEVGRVAAGLAG
ncbi:class A beta-lactamase [Lichenibacterium dinghuense]|uniref:class A beta-lactamase n=1 Tax=Lichenibacterium dinghuense TaxID=2895977 RepID=UPI001EFEFE28|nr:class A beta-lactamase [Lichenibacterium sp. 6Y81]